MQAQLPKEYAGRLMRAIVEFQLIEPGDRILVGLSGGKDSVFLTYALSALRKQLPVSFTLGAMTIDPQFSEDFPVRRLAAFCHGLDVPFHAQRVDIAGIIRAQQGKDPCYTCAFFRRGALNRYAVENGYNKIAYAHHHDDAVETFLMSLLYAGQLKAFLPKTYLDRSGLTVIRPLLYFREATLEQATPLHGFTPIASPCPMNGKTKRQEIKERLARLSAQNPAFYDHLAAAMRQSPAVQLWPAPKSRAQLKVLYRNFMYGKSSK